MGILDKIVEWIAEQVMNLLDMSLGKLEKYIVSLGQPKFRAKQIFTQLHKGILLDEMTNVGKLTKEKSCSTLWDEQDVFMLIFF